VVVRVVENSVLRLQWATFPTLKFL